MSDPCQTRGSSGIVMTSMPLWNWAPGCPRTGRALRAIPVDARRGACAAGFERVLRRPFELAPFFIRHVHTPVEVQLPQLGVSIVRAAPRFVPLGPSRIDPRLSGVSRDRMPHGRLALLSGSIERIALKQVKDQSRRCRIRIVKQNETKLPDQH